MVDRTIQTVRVNAMLAGLHVEVGTAEVLVEDGKAIKVISFTPKDFNPDELLDDNPTSKGDPNAP